MNNFKTSFASRVRLYVGALIAMLLAGSVVQSEAQVYVTSTANGITYKVTYDTSQNGFTEWSADGVNQLAIQSLYYSTGGSLTLLTPSSATASTLFSKKITVNYTIPEGTIQDVMTLNGSTMGQQITFNNTSGSDLSSFSIFQYSDFILGGPGYAGNQTVNMLPENVSTGQHALANQSGGGLTLTWQGFVNGTTRVQADGSGAPFGAFIGAGPYPYNLDNSTTNAINTDAVFGFQFSGSVLNGNSLGISETSAFPVPEPSSAALISSGMLAVALLICRRRRIKKA